MGSMAVQCGVDGSFRWVDLSMTEPSLTATNEFLGLSMAIGRVDGRIERAIVWLMGIEASRSALGSSANQPVAIAAMPFFPAPHPSRQRRSGVSPYTPLRFFLKRVLATQARWPA
jgi:hypothetical protein